MADENSFIQEIKFKVDDSELRAAVEFMKKELGNVSVSISSKLQTDLNKAGTEAEKTAKDVEKIGTEAEKTASDVEKIGKNLNKVDNGAKKAAVGAKKQADETKRANQEAHKLQGAWGKVAGAVKGALASYVGFKGISKLIGFGQGSIAAFSAQKRSELQLDTVLKNRNLGYASGYIKDAASEIQKRTTIGDESMIAGAAELATYVQDPRQLKRMMSLLADYSMGMTGGAELSPEALTNLATGLGKAFDGSYEAMRKKGFDTSELETIEKALKLNEDIEKGNVSIDKKTGELKLSNDEKQLLKWLNKNKGKNIEEMKITALENAMKDWKGLAEEFAKTDEGKIQQLKNTIGDMREEVGRKLLPVVGKLAKELKANLPALEEIFDSLSDAIVSLIDAVRDNMDNIKTFAKVMSKLVSFIAGNITSIIAFAGTLNAIKTFAPFASTGMGLVAAGIVGLAVVAIETSKKLRKARENSRYADAAEAVENFKRKRARVIQLKKQGKAWDQFSGKSVTQLEQEVMEDQKAVQKKIADYANTELQNGGEAGVEQEWLDAIFMSKGFNYKDSQGHVRHVFGKDANGDVTGLAEWKKKEQEFFDTYKDFMNGEMLKAKGDTTNNFVTVTNNITTDSDLVAKSIKENLRTLLTSQLNFTSRTSAAKALAI